MAKEVRLWYRRGRKLKLLDDLLISKIRKVTITALKESDLETSLWATKDSIGNWILVCRACIIVWEDHNVDHDSVKLDKLIIDGLATEGTSRVYLELFEEAEWLSVIAPNTGKIVKANLLPVTCALGAGFEYTKPGWSRTVIKKRAYYRPEYIQLAQEIAGVSSNLRFMVYPDGERGVWLVICEGRRPFMVVSNVAETVNAEENTCTTA